MEKSKLYISVSVSVSLLILSTIYRYILLICDVMLIKMLIRINIYNLFIYIIKALSLFFI
jgi:hypothetical protein